MFSSHSDSRDELVDAKGEKVPQEGLTRGLPNNEPIKCWLWYDEEAKALKMTYYFLAGLDPAAPQCEQGVEDLEKHDAYWLDYKEAVERLWYDGEKSTVIAALGLLPKCREDWASKPRTRWSGWLRRLWRKLRHC
jgi:hypothetical protein